MASFDPIGSKKLVVLKNEAAKNQLEKAEN
jgi:hypothetical protein